MPQLIGTKPEQVPLNQHLGKLAYQDGPVTIAQGGTGSTTAAAALTALGAYPASNPNAFITSASSITGNAATATTATNVSGGTASVTTLSASGAVTLSGGTAGGVPYLNGSKVLTTGSALTFDGARLAVNSSDPTVGNGQMVVASANQNGIVVNNTVAGQSATLYFRDLAGSNPGRIKFMNANGLTFLDNNDTEFMRLTSTGLGIGTSSPSYKLDVNGSTRVIGTFVLQNGDFALTTKVDPMIYTNAANPIRFGINSSEQMRLTSTGLGIGTSSPAAKLEVSGNSGLGAGTGSPIAIRIGDTSQDGGASTWNTTTDFTQLQFYSADASTPGGANIRYTVGAVMENPAGQTTALTFRSSSGGSLTERMRLDSSGNVGIGTSSPNEKLVVAGRGIFNVADASYATAFNATNGNLRITPYVDANFGTNLRAFNAGYAGYGPLSFDASRLLFYTGGSERMRLDSSGNLGIGTSSPSTYGSKIVSYGSTADTFIGLSAVNDSATAANSLERKGIFAHGGATADGISAWVNSLVVEGQANGGVAIGSYNPNASVKFYTGALRTERARIDSSGNLGIGTSSPATNLEVVGASTTQIRLRMAGQADMRVISDTGYGALSLESNMPLLFRTNATERMRLDSSGNLGLGVTPSAWGSGFSAIDLGGNSRISGNTSMIVGNNSFFNGTNWIYKNSASAGLYVLPNAGGHQFFTAPSGTAGNAISFTQAMTLDASGNLVVGDTNTNARFKAALTGASTASITTVSDFGASGILSLGSVANNNQGVYLGTGDARTGVNGGIAAGIGFLREAAGWNSALAFYTNATTDGSTTNRITERARIDSSGNLLIGTTTSAGYKLEVAGVAAATDFNSTSDRTKKTNITTIPNALEKVQQLRGVEFDWLDTGAPAMGLIAQEVAQVIPQVVQGESGNMTLSYGNLVGLLIEAVKAQQQQISELQTAVAKLTKE